MATAVRSLRVATLGGFALQALAIAYGLAVAISLHPDVPTTYAATSSGAAAADLAAGLGLIAAGALAWLERPAGPIGPLATLLGVAWLAPNLVGWDDGPEIARSVGMLAAPFLLPLLAHLALAFPGGRIAAPGLRRAVAVAYSGTIVLSVGRALFRNPFLDRHCWSNCTDNVFLVHADRRIADALDTLWLGFSVAVGLSLAAICIGRLVVASRPARAASWAVLAPAALAAGAETAYAIALLLDPGEDPRGAVFHAVFLARALALAGLAGGVAWSLVRARRTRQSISRLAADLGEAPQPGSLRAALARSLGDAELEVAYWLPDSQRYVDGGGRATEPADGRERVATPILRGGEPVALVSYDRALSGTHDLEREIGAAARLAVDNERLRAAVLAQLDDLRASRTRVVEAGDAARRRLERDLHDGAQQQLLALSYDLRVARAAAEAAGDAAGSALLAAAMAEAQAALEELRELAHGIHPAVLTEGGLVPAVASLADAAPLVVEVGDVSPLRYPAGVETAAYVVVAEAIADAAGRRARYVSVRIVEDDGQLMVEVEDDGSARASAMTHVADRVGALGGRVIAEPTRLLAEIPCG